MITIALMLSVNATHLYAIPNSIHPLPKTEIQEHIDYLIITNSELEDIFSRLISYKSQFTSSKMVNLSTILSDPLYSGRDIQETIRNFIRYAHENWSTKYVLLGGDDSIIPHRALWGSMIDWKGTRKESQIPSDLYYACLDGTWDDDGDGIYGERKKDSISDEADYHAEVFVGRAPVENRFEASVFINKVISYETSEKPLTVQCHLSGLNPENNPSLSNMFNKITSWIPNEIAKKDLYAYFQNISIKNWTNCFREGCMIIEHIGNGGSSYYELDNIDDSVIWHAENISELRNNFYPIHTSLACHIGDFVENDCIAEEMILYPNGGVSAFICNSDFGATDSQNAYLYSGEFLERIFYEIFENNTLQLGPVQQMAKEYFSRDAKTNEKYRWCYYTVNLLGDPETPIFEKRNNEHPIIISVDDDFTPSTPGYNESKFSSIQQAIDESSEDGLILVYNGEYHEHILINKSVFLIGTNRDFENDYTYSGISLIDGDHQGNPVTITHDDVIMNGFTIINSGENHSGILISNASQVSLYRCNVVRNKGTGITLHKSAHCVIENCYVSFNENHGIFVFDSSYNTIECSLVSYNINNAGIYLLDANHNQIKGKKQVEENPLQFYVSTLYQKTSYNLSDRTQMISFSKDFMSLLIQDFFDQLYYFPSRPPEKENHLFSNQYLCVLKNKNGIVLDRSSENSIQQVWIQENSIGILYRNTSEKINPTLYNFISGNTIGVLWVNASIHRFELNNICYNEQNTVVSRVSNVSSTRYYHPYQLMLAGNIVLNNETFFPLFDYLLIEEEEPRFSIVSRIRSVVNYLSIVPLLVPFMGLKIAQSLRNETRSLVGFQVMLGMMFMFFPVFLKLIKISNQPPLIWETYYQ